MIEKQEPKEGRCPRMDRKQQKVSVRNLVEFLLREVNIDSRRGTRLADREAMLAGGRIHRKI